MYAVVQSGGKQYRVSPGDVIHVEKMDGDVGAVVELNEILMVDDDEKIAVGQPRVDGFMVVGQIVAQDRGPKITIFKHKRRKGYRKKQGHRQYLTSLRIREIKGL
jgi:large subunit ribosomal protein L21